MPGPRVPARSVHVCATRPERSPSLNHLGFWKPLGIRSVGAMEPQQRHLKLPIHPPRGQHGANVQRRLQGRHVQFAVGEGGEVEHVALAVQGGGDNLARELVGKATVATLRGPAHRHHFHLPMANADNLSLSSALLQSPKELARSNATETLDFWRRYGPIRLRIKVPLGTSVPLNSNGEYLVLTTTGGVTNP